MLPNYDKDASGRRAQVASVAHPGVDQPAHKDDLKGPSHHEKAGIQPGIQRTGTRVHEMLKHAKLPSTNYPDLVLV